MAVDSSRIGRGGQQAAPSQSSDGGGAGAVAILALVGLGIGGYFLSSQSPENQGGKSSSPTSSYNPAKQASKSKPSTPKSTNSSST